MVINRKTIERLIENLDLLFPKPDPDAKIEDMVGCFEDLFPKDKSSVDLIREERAKMFGLAPDDSNE